MSEAIYDRKGLWVTSFSGGSIRGPCVQIDADVAKLTAVDVKTLVIILDSWLERIGYDPDDPTGFWKKDDA